jgi:arylsulfatase A-like enzyme
VLVVVIENTRADHLSAYGHARRTSPELEGLAREGVLFEDCTAPGAESWSSHVALFSGLLPHAAPTAGGRARREAGLPALERDLPTLAERFQQAGYATHAVSSDEWLAPELGLLRGFTHSQMAKNDLEVVELSQRSIARAGGSPLLLWVALSGPRAPYEETEHPWLVAHAAALDPKRAPEWLEPYLLPPEPGRRRSVDLSEDFGESMSGNERYMLGLLDIPSEGLELLRDLYDGELADADARLGELVKSFRAAHPDGIVAVTSDHGELFGERGLVGHSGHVYPEVVRVPLVISAPGRLPVGVRTRTPVPLHELHATLLDLAGIARRPDSLVAVALGAPRQGPIAAVAFRDADAARLLGGRYAHTWAMFRSGNDVLVLSSGGSLELYDTASDPGMRTNLTPQRSTQAATLRREAEAFLVGAIEPRPDETPSETSTEIAEATR